MWSSPGELSKQAKSVKSAYAHELRTEDTHFRKFHARFAYFTLVRVDLTRLGPLGCDVPFLGPPGPPRVSRSPCQLGQLGQFSLYQFGVDFCARGRRARGPNHPIHRLVLWIAGPECALPWGPLVGTVFDLKSARQACFP